MKIVEKPIDMVPWFDSKGVAHPIKFRYTKEEGDVVVKVDRIITREMEKLAGNPMIIYRCKNIINGIEKEYEIKYELNTCKWILFKI